MPVHPISNLTLSRLSTGKRRKYLLLYIGLNGGPFCISYTVLLEKLSEFV
jgi:hypothetical protein